MPSCSGFKADHPTERDRDKASAETPPLGIGRASPRLPVEAGQSSPLVAPRSHPSDNQVGETIGGRWPIPTLNPAVYFGFSTPARSLPYLKLLPACLPLLRNRWYPHWPSSLCHATYFSSSSERHARPIFLVSSPSLSFPVIPSIYCVHI